MSNNYQPGQAASINPATFQKESTTQQYDPTKFAALVKVVSSRYVKHEYNGGQFAPKIALEWTMVSTSGKPFSKKWSTGLPFADDSPAAISPDGTRLVARSADFQGLRPNSDSVYLIQKAVAAGFPADLLTDNVAVFEGHAFFIATDVNPNSKGSAEKPYPKYYYPEGFEAALAARNAKKMGQPGANTTSATMVSSYTPPTVVATPQTPAHIANEAGTVLMEIVALTGGKIDKTGIPAKLNELAPTKGWSAKQRQDITLALWSSLGDVVALNPALQLTGDTVSFK